MPQLKEQNGRYYQEAEVVMLATKEYHSDIELDETLQLSKHKGYCNKNGQQLYIVSNEDIKKGDWILDIVTKLVTISNNIENAKSSGILLKRDWRKIIATTDESLKIDNDITNQTSVIWDKTDIERVIVGSKSLPKPSDSFISKYIEEYNKGNQITDILVEYSPKEYKIGDKVHIGGKDWEVDIKVEWSELFKGFYFGTRNGGTWKCFEYELKVDSDNTITIKKVKDSYSREEVMTLFSELQYDMAQQLIGNRGPDKIIPLEWIEENL